MLQRSIGGYLARSSRVAGEGLPRGRAGWVGVGLVAGIMAITGLTAMRTRSEILTDTERQLAQLDTVFAEQTGRALETVNFLLKTAIDTVQSSPPADINALLARRLAGVRQLTALMIADATGHVLYSSEPHPPTMLPAPGEQVPEEAIAAPNADLHISNPERDPNRTWYALVARAITDYEGRCGPGPATSGWAATSRSVAARRPFGPAGRAVPAVRFPRVRLSFFTAPEFFVHRSKFPLDDPLRPYYLVVCCSAA